MGKTVAILLSIFLLFNIQICQCQRAFMTWVTELAKCYTPGVLYEEDICTDCIGKCIAENLNPATGIQFPDGHERPTCDFCRRACYAVNAKSCAYSTGYITGIPCSDWGAVGYCI